MHDLPSRRLEPGDGGVDRFRRIFESSPTGLYLYRTREDGTLVLAGANPAANRLVGIDHRVLVGLPPEVAFPTLAGTGFPERLRAVAAGTEREVADEIAYQDERFDGVYEYSAFQVAPGEVAVMFTEIGARKRAEAALRASEEKYRLLVENQTDLVVKVDTDGRFLFASPSYCRLFGKAEAELLGRAFLPLVHEDDRAATEEAMTALHRPPWTCQVEQRAMTVHGWRRLAWVDTAVRDAAGRVVAVVGVGRDVTEVREVEARLRQSEKLEAIGRLAGGVAHDFNNQLTGILGGAEFLRAAVGEGPEVRRAVEGIRDAALRSAHLTRQLLAFARRGDGAREIVDLHRVLDDVVELLSRTIDKRITLERIHGAGRAVVRGDSARLHAALVNLALNGCDAMPAGGTLRLETRLVEGEGDGDRVELRVSDTGAGLTPEARAHLFEPFFTTKPVGRGSGLGLAEVYGTVSGHGGGITVDSTAGQGTCVTLWLPAHAREEQPPRAEGRDRVDVARPPPAPLRILLVDDERNVRQSLRLLLSAAGHEVVECAGGREAVERYRERWRELDVVILDLVMPDLAGPDAFAALRAVNAAVPVILSSGYSAGAQLGALASQPGVVVLPKPFTSRQLDDALAAARGALR